jgi:hypothetical protein
VLVSKGIIKEIVTVSVQGMRAGLEEINIFQI